VVRWSNAKDAPKRCSGGSQEVTDTHEQGAGVGRHVLDVGRQQVVAKEGVLGVPWDGLDEVFLIGGGVKGLLEAFC